MLRRSSLLLVLLALALASLVLLHAVDPADATRRRRRFGTHAGSTSNRHRAAASDSDDDSAGAPSTPPPPPSSPASSSPPPTPSSSSSSSSSHVDASRPPSSRRARRKAAAALFDEDVESAAAEGGGAASTAATTATAGGDVDDSIAFPPIPGPGQDISATARKRKKSARQLQLEREEAERQAKLQQEEAERLQREAEEEAARLQQEEARRVEEQEQRAREEQETRRRQEEAEAEERRRREREAAEAEEEELRRREAEEAAAEAAAAAAAAAEELAEAEAAAQAAAEQRRKQGLAPLKIDEARAEEEARLARVAAMSVSAAGGVGGKHVEVRGLEITLAESTRAGEFVELRTTSVKTGNVAHVEISEGQQLSVRFSVFANEKKMFVRQPFVRIRNAATELTLPAKQSKGGYLLRIPFSTELLERYSLRSADYDVDLILADPSATNGILWTFARLSLSVPAVKADGSPNKLRFASPLPKPNTKPEQEHMFSAPETRPGVFMSLVFSGVIAFLGLVYLVLSFRAGANLSNLNFVGLLFLVCLGGLLALLVAFWLFMRLSTTLLYMSMLTVPTLYFGNLTLRHLASLSKVDRA